jgi:glycosidase
MRRYLGYTLVTSLACLLSIAGCGDDELPSTAGGAGLSGGTGGNGGNGGSGGTGGEDTTGRYIRIHYRTQDGADPKSWGVHFWGPVAKETAWGMPQLFDKTDEFGVYTDVAVNKVEDLPDAWLGLIPVQCSGGTCKQDVQTSVRFFDLQKNAENANIAECWITQGQAVQTKEPMGTGPAYKITRSKDFIDLGDGSVRLMFRVAKGSTGMVTFGKTPDALDTQIMWTEADDVNKKGITLQGLTPGQSVYYKIRTSLMAGGQELKDETAVLDIKPIAFTSITDAADWATWGGKEVMYQLIVRTFADGGSKKNVADPEAESGIDTSTKDGVGDLVGLKNTLPYLKDLGADAIWMTPVFKAKSYHGYDTTDFYDIDPAVGTRKDFVDLAKAAREMNIKIILDLVQNHVADVNPWFIKGSNPKDPEFAKYHDWFVWSDEYSNMVADPHPWDPSAVIWACKNYMCYHQIFGTAMPELNYHNPEVRAEMKKISKFWIDLGADGFRLDASKHIDQFDDNNTIALSEHGTHVWWKEFNHFVKKDVVRPAGSPTVMLTGENRWDDPKVYKNMVPYGGDMDSQFDFPFRSLLSNLVGGKTGLDVDFANYINKLKTDLGSPANGGNPNHYFQRFLSNHDLERPATQFESSGAMLDALLKQAATVVFTVPGMPVVYYGEEFGKKGKRDKYLGTEGWEHDEFIREPMSWFQNVIFTGDKMTAWNIDYTKTNETNTALMLGAGVTVAPNPDYPFIKFMTENDPHSWAAQKGDSNSLFAYYKKLIQIRKTTPLLTDLTATITKVTNDANIYEMSLSKGIQSVSVVLNRKGSEQNVTRLVPVLDLITGKTDKTFTLPPYGAAILQ